MTSLPMNAPRIDENSDAHAPNRRTPTCLWRLLARNLHGMLQTRGYTHRMKRRGRRAAILLNPCPVDARTSTTARQGPVLRLKHTNGTSGATPFRSGDLLIRKKTASCPGQLRYPLPMPWQRAVWCSESAFLSYAGRDSRCARRSLPYVQRGARSSGRGDAARQVWALLVEGSNQHPLV